MARDCDSESLHLLPQPLCHPPPLAQVHPDFYPRLDPLDAGVHGVAIRKARNISGRDRWACREGGRRPGCGFLPYQITQSCA